MLKIVSRLLDTVGDGSGNQDATGDYIGAVEDFIIKPASGEIFEIERMIVSVVDTTGMDADSYGNNITLVNGIEVLVLDSEGSTIYSLTDPNHPVLTNGHWAHYCYDADIKTWGQGNEHLVVRWTFGKSGRPVIVRGHAGESLVVRLNDTFTGLISQHFVVQGIETKIEH